MYLPNFKNVFVQNLTDVFAQNFKNVFVQNSKNVFAQDLKNIFVQNLTNVFAQNLKNVFVQIALHCGSSESFLGVKSSGYPQGTHQNSSALYCIALRKHFIEIGQLQCIG